MMVHFYNGSNANYVTLPNSTSEFNISDKDVKKDSMYGRIVKKTQCKGDVMVVKIITTILLVAMMALIYMSYAQHNEIISMRIQTHTQKVVPEKLKPTEKGLNDSAVCNFSIGNGVAVSQFRIGYQKGKVCVKACLHMKEIYPAINGVTVTKSRWGNCWCEKNMTSIGGTYKTCFFNSNITQMLTGLNDTSSCELVAGDGGGGYKFKIGNQKGNACISACLHLKKIDAKINGVTVLSNTTIGGCWCQKKMVYMKPSKLYKTCFFNANDTQQRTALNDHAVCNFSIGNGHGEHEFRIGSQQGNACINACLHMKEIDATINGVTEYTSTYWGGCWCEQNMTGVIATYKTCFLKSNNTQILRGLNGTSICNFSNGNGVGVSQIKVGNQKGNACIDACLHMKKIYPTINGVTVYSNTSRGGCWCEQNMTSISGTYKTCFLKSNTTQILTGLNGTSTCKFITADGSGGYKFKIGNQKGNACINACLHLMKIDAEINGVTVYSNNTKGGCWCQKHMTSMKSSKVYKTCFLKSNDTQQHTGLDGSATCKFSSADGPGEHGFKIGYQKGTACIDACLHMRMIDPSITAVTTYSNGRWGGCWCEHNMTSVSRTSETCFLEPPTTPQTYTGLDGTYTCKFSIGDGFGGHETYMGDQKGSACIKACLHMKKIDPTINGVTTYTYAKWGGCWCEQNMSSITQMYKTCFLKSDITQIPTGLNGSSICKFIPGDGAGDAEFRIGKQKGDACINACLHLKQINPTINGVTLYTNSIWSSCWCEQNMKTIGGRYKTCYLIRER